MLDAALSTINAAAADKMDWSFMLMLRDVSVSCEVVARWNVIYAERMIDALVCIIGLPSREAGFDVCAFISLILSLTLSTSDACCLDVRTITSEYGTWPM